MAALSDRQVSLARQAIINQLAAQPKFNPIKPITGAAKSAANAVGDAAVWALKNGPIQDPKQTQMPRVPRPKPVPKPRVKPGKPMK